MKRLMTLGFALVLVGCAATPICPGAERVRLTNNEPGNERTFLGDVTGNQGNFLSGPVTSNQNLETGARNDLKNKAAAMGGNVVYLLTNRAGETGGYGGVSRQTNVTLSGNVLQCPVQG